MADQEIVPMDAVTGEAMIRMEQAAIDCQIATAKRYPKHEPNQLSKVKDAMLTFATIDEETAQSCFYTLPRGGKVIQGPSVRMAEIAVTCFGNIRTSARTVSVVTTGDTPHVIVQAATHDLEQNVAVCIEKRRRITKKKGKEQIDEDDINLAVNSGIAIAFRDAVFKIIPLALIKPVYEQAKRVAIGDIRSLSAKRTAVIDKLQHMGATLERILDVVNARKIEDVGLNELEVLIGLGTALKEGAISLEDAFPATIQTLEPTNGRKSFGFDKQQESPSSPMQVGEPTEGQAALTPPGTEAQPTHQTTAGPNPPMASNTDAVDPASHSAPPLFQEDAVDAKAFDTPPTVEEPLVVCSKGHTMKKADVLPSTLVNSRKGELGMCPKCQKEIGMKVIVREQK